MQLGQRRERLKLGLRTSPQGNKELTLLSLKSRRLGARTVVWQDIWRLNYTTAYLTIWKIKTNNQIIYKVPSAFPIKQEMLVERTSTMASFDLAGTPSPSVARQLHFETDVPWLKHIDSFFYEPYAPWTINCVWIMHILSSCRYLILPLLPLKEWHDRRNCLKRRRRRSLQCNVLLRCHMKILVTTIHIHVLR